MIEVENHTKSLRMKSSSKKSDANMAVRSIAKKLAQSNIRVATVVSCCEELDRNLDGLVSIEDLKAVFTSLMGKDRISDREIRHLAPLLGADRSNRGSIAFKNLYDVIGDPRDNEPAEKWYDDEECEDVQWATQRGSVGEWLKRGSCPSEVKNFQRFIHSLEEFERSSGMKCTPKGDGFTVPLGPDLRVSISFSLT